MNIDKKYFIFWNDKELYEAKTRQIMMDSLKSQTCKMWMISILDNFFSEYTLDKTLNEIKAGNLSTNVLVRREEHGRLWGGSKQWKHITKECNAIGIKTMMYDFGYFNHYDTYMIDTYNSPDCASDIYRDWEGISPDPIDWSSTPEYLQTYRRNVLNGIDKARQCAPIDGLKSQEYVVVWPQYSMDLLRPEFKQSIPNQKTEVTDWVNMVCKSIKDAGLTPVVKGGPAMTDWPRFVPEKINATVYAHKEKQVKSAPMTKFEKDINYKLIAHAKYHVVSCSSVTNELVLSNSPVVAMGQSWFTGLDIFQEPNTWDSLLNDPMNINEKNRNKWVRWWLSRQVKKENVVEKFFEIYNKYPL